MRREVLYSASLHLFILCGVYMTATWVDKPKPRSIKPIEVKFIGARKVRKPQKRKDPTPKPTKRIRKPSLSTSNVLRPTRKPSRRPTRRPTVKSVPTRKPTRKAAPTRRPTRKPTRRATRKAAPTRRPTVSPPNFGSSLLDKVKNAWSKDPVPTKKPTKSKPSLPTKQPSLKLPTLPALPATKAPLQLAAIPRGMRVGGAVPSSAGWYLAEVKEELDRNWIRPSRAAGEQRCEVTFVIRRDGRVGGVSLSSPSANESFNRSVLAAVQRVERFKKLPKGVGDSSGERFFLTFVLSAF